MHQITPLDHTHYDEMLAAGQEVRPSYQHFASWLNQATPDWLRDKQAEADTLFRRVGITFAVYGDESGSERLIPFDTIPRIISASEWKTLEAGCIQRVTALNRFLHDIYHDQDILKAGIIPPEQILTNAGYQLAMQGIDLPRQVYAHIAGVDIIRHNDGGFYVLEDNLRTPSGVSYMLENRKMMMRLFPELFASHDITPVEHYPNMLLDTLRSVSPAEVDNPTVVVLTPGQYNSAYFEHAL
uniref:Circularly permuted ATPgrasp domain-containing protein n=1 Tax=Anopheles coluzzii TaxID=1518534 RepID=A0A8W7PXH1_ANOCL